MAAQNTFKGANTEFPNLGIHFILSEIIKFRKQLTVRQEFKSQSGWNNALNRYSIGKTGKSRGEKPYRIMVLIVSLCFSYFFAGFLCIFLLDL